MLASMNHSHKNQHEERQQCSAGTNQVLSYIVCAYQCEMCLQWEHVVCTGLKGGSIVCLFVCMRMQVIYWLYVFARVMEWWTRWNFVWYIVQEKNVKSWCKLIVYLLISSRFLKNGMLYYLMYRLLKVQPAKAQKNWLRSLTALKPLKTWF